VAKLKANRRCAGCGQKFDKSQLAPATPTPDGDWKRNTGGKVSLFSINLCNAPECLEKIRNTNLNATPTPMRTTQTAPMGGMFMGGTENSENSGNNSGNESGRVQKSFGNMAQDYAECDDDIDDDDDDWDFDD